MNVVIPMAGQGSRFTLTGYQVPKPFIPIKGKPMIEWVIDNISDSKDKIYLICRTEHISYINNSSLPHRDNIAFIFVTHPTEGAACTVLKAKSFINTDEPVMIANSDQFVVYDKNIFNEKKSQYNGLILTFKSQEPKWSYALTNEYGTVFEVAEKKVISDKATTGIYWVDNGRFLVSGLEKMIKENKRVNNEFYVCPVFNEMTPVSHIGIFDVEKMYGLGTPEDLKENYDKIGSE
jgi:NDP-sugar pyrophosphorylase family protein